jgi:hypothetical protein
MGKGPAEFCGFLGLRRIHTAFLGTKVLGFVELYRLTARHRRTRVFPAGTQAHIERCRRELAISHRRQTSDLA